MTHNPSAKSVSQIPSSQSHQLVIGLTGGIGSGKTVVSDWFSQQGIDIIDADVIAHQIVSKGSPALNQLQKRFGNWIINEDGELNRPALREHVFADANALMTLEGITHPAIREQASQQLTQATAPYVIISAPLLLESSEAGLATLCQRILVIDVPENIQLQRASQRDGQAIDKIKAIMANQLPRTERCAKADDVIINDGTLEELYQKLTHLHQRYMTMVSTL